MKWRVVNVADAASQSCVNSAASGSPSSSNSPMPTSKPPGTSTPPPSTLANKLTRTRTRWSRDRTESPAASTVPALPPPHSLSHLAAKYSERRSRSSSSPSRSPTPRRKLKQRSRSRSKSRRRTRHVRRHSRSKRSRSRGGRRSRSRSRHRRKSPYLPTAYHVKKRYGTSKWN